MRDSPQCLYNIHQSIPNQGSHSKLASVLTKVRIKITLSFISYVESEMYSFWVLAISTFTLTTQFFAIPSNSKTFLHRCFFKSILFNGVQKIKTSSFALLMWLYISEFNWAVQIYSVQNQNLKLSISEPILGRSKMSLTYLVTYIFAYPTISNSPTPIESAKVSLYLQCVMPLWGMIDGPMKQKTTPKDMTYKCSSDHHLFRIRHRSHYKKVFILLYVCNPRQKPPTRLKKRSDMKYHLVLISRKLEGSVFVRWILPLL